MRNINDGAQLDVGSVSRQCVGAGHRDLLRGPTGNVSASGFPLLHLQGRLEILDELVSIEGLRQVASRSARKCPRTGLLIGECGKENERNAVTTGPQVFLQLDTAHTGHLNVRHHAGEIIKAVRPQELFGRRKCVDEISERSHEAVGRRAYGRIIIDDCDKLNLGQIDLSLDAETG
jgi:hypothetical protein